MYMSVRFFPVNQAFALDRAEVALAETCPMPMLDIMVSTSSTTFGSSRTHSCDETSDRTVARRASVRHEGCPQTEENVSDGRPIQ